VEVTEKSKKRELIKSIAIVFLVVLLILTFFSGTIMNYSLPEVATQVVSGGTINAKIRGSGTVAANENYEVVINQTREVRSVCVKAGDKVAEGDLLFVLGDMESQELQDAQEQLRKLNLDYQKQVLNFSKEYAENDRSVAIIREDLEKAIAKRDANQVTDSDISYAKGDLAAAKNELSQIELMLADLNSLQTDNEKYTQAKAKVDELKARETELQGKIESLNTTIDGYREDLGKLESGITLDSQRKIQDAQNALQQAQMKWQTDWTAYQIFMEELMHVINQMWTSTPHNFSPSEQIAIDGQLKQWELIGDKTEADQKPGTGDTTGTQPAAGARTIPDFPANSQYTVSQYRTAYDALIDDQTDVAAKQEALNRAQQDQSQGAGTAAQQRQQIESKINATQNDISSIQGDVSIVQSQLRDAEAQLEAASGENTQLKQQIKTYEASKRQQEANITTFQEHLTELEEKKKLYDEAQTTIDTKQQELETALSGKDIDKQLDNLELQGTRLQIEQQQMLVDKYKADSVDTEIKSKVSGIISAVNVTAGKDTTSGEAMAVIDVIDRGYTIKVSVTNDQAKQVKVGDSADVTNYRWGNDVSAVLEAITADPSAPGQKKLLVFRVSGEIEAGTNISLSIGQRSETFDTIVPKSALREDANGNFVLIITSRNTPLGNRYIANRVDVEVLAEDDTSAAVSGLSANDYVITTSSKPLDAGTQVRMVENT
jgi:multidrug efflux pump subunit AcrA (membrane-fusion protein)